MPWWILEAVKKVFGGTKTAKATNAPLFVRGLDGSRGGTDKYIVYLYYASFCPKECFPVEVRRETAYPSLLNIQNLCC